MMPRKKDLYKVPSTKTFFKISDALEYMKKDENLFLYGKDAPIGDGDPKGRKKFVVGKQYEIFESISKLDVKDWCFSRVSSR